MLRAEDPNKKRIIKALRGLDMPQDQRSVADQLTDLIDIAIAAGYQDAALFLVERSKMMERT